MQSMAILPSTWRDIKQFLLFFGLKERDSGAGDDSFQLCDNYPKLWFVDQDTSLCGK